MKRENKRRHERVETNVKAKLPGDSAWIECSACNVSGGGLLFEAVPQPTVGDFVELQFMLQAKSGTLGNVHFFASSRVVRVTPKADICEIAVEFIVDEDERKEILRQIAVIKSQSLRVDHPTTRHLSFDRESILRALLEAIDSAVAMDKKLQGSIRLSIHMERIKHLADKYREVV